MEINWLIHLLAAAVPMVVGFIWYNPKVFGNAWMREASMTEERLKSGNMGLIYGLAFFFSFMLTFMLSYLVDHTIGMEALFKSIEEHGYGIDKASEMGQVISGKLTVYAERYGTFKHGAFHGVLITVMFILPIVAIISLFERKSFKYVLINVGYWALTLALMGGVLCQWA